MSRLMSLCSAAALLVFATGVASVQAGHRAVTLAVIMTNDPMSNQIKVYDVGTHVLLQTLSTHGKGGVGGNARGVKQYNGELVRGRQQRIEHRRHVQARRQRPQVRQAGDDDQRAGERGFRQRSPVRGRGDDGRFICAASEQRGVDGWHDRAGIGRRRAAARMAARRKWA